MTGLVEDYRGEKRVNKHFHALISGWLGAWCLLVSFQISKFSIAFIVVPVFHKSFEWLHSVTKIALFPSVYR